MADSFQNRTLCNGFLPLPGSPFFTPALRSRAGAVAPAPGRPGGLQQASLGSSSWTFASNWPPFCAQPLPQPAAELIKSRALFHTFEKFKGTHILGRPGSKGTWIGGYGTSGRPLLCTACQCQWEGRSNPYRGQLCSVLWDQAVPFDPALLLATGTVVAMKQMSSPSESKWGIKQTQQW